MESKREPMSSVSLQSAITAAWTRDVVLWNSWTE